MLKTRHTSEFVITDPHQKGSYAFPVDLLSTEKLKLDIGQGEQEYNCIKVGQLMNDDIGIDSWITEIKSILIGFNSPLSTSYIYCGFVYEQEGVGNNLHELGYFDVNVGTSLQTIGVAEQTANEGYALGTRLWNRPYDTTNVDTLVIKRFVMWYAENLGDSLSQGQEVTYPAGQNSEQVTFIIEQLG